MNTRTIRLIGIVALTLTCATISWGANGCADLPSQSDLKAALIAATNAEGQFSIL